MALLNRPLTEDELRRLWACWKTYDPGSFTRGLLDAVDEPTPHQVVYRNGKVVYVPPTTFYIGPKSTSPSNCTWIVPGTHERDEKGFW